MRQTEKAIVQGGHVASDDEEDDAGVVELVAPLGDVLGVVHEGVEGSTHAEAEEGAGEEAGEDEEPTMYEVYPSLHGYACRVYLGVCVCVGVGGTSCILQKMRGRLRC